MPRIVCVKCEVKFKPKRNGVHVVETFGVGSDEPYKLWQADLWECPQCGAEVVSGFANREYAQHYQENFKVQFENAEPKYWDKSC